MNRELTDVKRSLGPNHLVRIEREILLLEMRRDELGDELITDDIAKREMAMDKEFIRLIQSACKTDNIPRAIEVCKLLHHTVSFDMAVKVANFYHLSGLREKIEILKADREEEDRLAIARDRRRQWTKPDRPPRILPSSRDERPSSKPLQDFSEPPAINRPGLAKVTPHVERTRYSNDQQSENNADSKLAPFTTPEGKRKRVETDEPSLIESPKRRVVSDVSLAPPKPASKPLGSFLQHSC
jgi:chromosome transmission fidelity protein 4